METTFDLKNIIDSIVKEKGIEKQIVLDALEQAVLSAANKKYRNTRDLEAHVRRADIVVVGVGKAGLVKGEWIKPGAVVIDIGMNRLENGKLVGDVEFDAAAQNAGWITPVPGGVGPMTVTMLMYNTLYAAEQLHQ